MKYAEWGWAQQSHCCRPAQGPLSTLLSSALQSGLELIHSERQASDPLKFLGPPGQGPLIPFASSSSLYPPPFLRLFTSHYQPFSNFQISGGGERKWLVTLQVSIEEQTRKADKETPARFYDLSLGMGFPAIKCLLT